MTMKHSPLETWEMDKGDDGAVIYQRGVGTIANIPITLKAWEQNAAYIVKACNAYPKLMEALERFCVITEDVSEGKIPKSSAIAQIGIKSAALLAELEGSD